MNDAERDAMVEGWLRNVREPDPVKFPEEYKQWTWLQKLSVMKQMRDEIKSRGEDFLKVPGAEESVRAGEALYDQLVDTLAECFKQAEEMKERVQPAIEEKRKDDILTGRKYRILSNDKSILREGFLDEHKN